MSFLSSFLYRLSCQRGVLAQYTSYLWRAELGLKGVQGWRQLHLDGRIRAGIVPGSSIVVGPGTVFNNAYNSNPLGCVTPCLLSTASAHAHIIIGEGCGFSATTIVAAREITIGDRCLAGSGAMIIDTDFHLMDENGHWRTDFATPAQSVKLEDDVFLGARSIVLKGTTIGRGSVVGAGAVVKGSFPPHSVIAGNPGRVVKTLPFKN